MPLATAPNIIEVSDFAAGWSPDYEAAAVLPNGLLDALNLLPDIGSGALQTRKGFKRLGIALPSGWRVESLHPYTRDTGVTRGTYLMVVMTNGDDGGADNVRVLAVDLATGAILVTLIQTQAKADARHYGAVIGGTFYGGGPNSKMYSWNPDDGFDADPSTQAGWPDLVTGVVGAGEKGSDFAFQSGDEVLWLDDQANTYAYSAATHNRFKRWKLDRTYRKRDKVSIRTTDANGTYMRSYRCIDKHKATAARKPEAGANWEDFWEKEELALPRDEDGAVSEDWNLIPTAAQTGLAVWHGDRLFMRWDGSDDVGSARLQYSAPAKPKKGSDISQLEWDPRDFRVGRVKGTPSGREGEGGGWLPPMPEPITALQSFGYYLLVFTRHRTKVLAGVNENSWVFRDLAPVGAIGPRAVTEHEGIVYFVSDRGFYQTDGTQVVEVPGADKITEWLTNTVDWEDSTGRVNDVNLWAHDGYVWMSLPTTSSGVPDLVVVYDPNTKSFWPQAMEVQAAAVARLEGIDQLLFSPRTLVGTATTFSSTYAWLGAAHRSQSTRTTAAVVETNRFSDPSFETEGLTFSSIKDSLNSSGWAKTTADKVKLKKTVSARMRGQTGMAVTNTRIKAAVNFEGIHQTFADEDTGTQHIVGYFRKSNWKDFPRLGYNHLRIMVDDAEISSNDHTFEKLGRGWWKVTATFAGSLTARTHGFVVKPQLTVYADKMMCAAGATPAPYFDGDGGDGDLSFSQTVGGATALVMQYNHPDVQETPTDDTGDAAYAGSLIPWVMRTAWFPFGVLREERRVRRIWTLVRGTAICNLRAYRNYADEAEFEAESLPDEGSATFFEGVSMPDAFSVSVGMQGLGAPSTVLGVALDTQPRRIRYHT